MYFSHEKLDELYDGVALLQAKYANLRELYTLKNYQQPRAREFAQHGFARRLKTLTRCIEQVFTLIPPETEEEPPIQQRTDAEIAIQAFVSCVFGSLDNLAWILVHEKQITQANGQPIPKGWVGLRPDNAFLRGTLSPNFQQYLGTLDQWFGYLEGYRHALAHRIPLYIPPYVVSPDHPNGVFRPWIMHSYEEIGVHPFVFHPQMLADYNTVEEVALRVADEL